MLAHIGVILFVLFHKYLSSSRIKNMKMAIKGLMILPYPSSLYVFQVESFILDQEDLDNPIMKTASELLLSSATDGVDLRTVDPETQARLEALLEAAGTVSLSEINSS